eukprot:2721927-Pleurochrysis_carterae.AAC.1
MAHGTRGGDGGWGRGSGALLRVVVSEEREGGKEHEAEERARGRTDAVTTAKSCRHQRASMEGGKHR